MRPYEPYANVIVDISHEKVDRPFQYKIPQQLQGILQIGMEVEIPFGRGNTTRKGYVIELTDQLEYEESKVKEMLGIVEKKQSVEGQMIQVANYMKEQYGTTMIAALRTVLPVKHQIAHVVKRTVTLVTTKEYAKEQLVVFQQKKQVARVRLLEQLIHKQTVSYEWLVKECKLTKATFEALEEQRLITVTSKNEYRNPVKNIQKALAPVTLSEEQQRIIDVIREDVTKNQLGKYLIHGITGSGKTEVYLRLIEGVIARGKQAIVLIPEIALTYQTASRFYNRFGERVSILNSKMSAGERYDQIERAKSGDLDVMIGPRSALFTPFEQLGLIIIDEEHESSYKSEQVPKYHVREVAYYYASLHGAGVVLGSATPSVETYYKVQQGEIRLLELTTRLTGGELPSIFVEDMREELKAGNRTMFSRRLTALLQERLERKEQVMLFLNRRGLSGFTSCRSCGYVVKCIHCDISLSKHGNGKMMCHYCGYEEGYQKECPSCHSPFLYEFKIGTQQVVEYLQKTMPYAKVIRMDSDTTSQKHQYEGLLRAFEQQE
ncbi:MAG: primosomal protein N', partial [Eubacteriales bacterium]